MSATPQTTDPSTNADADAQWSKDLGATIRKSVESPFAALIASVEALGSADSDGEARSGRVGNAIEMLESVRHGVQALVDLVAPSESIPLRCGLAELGRSAVLATPAPVRASLHIAIDDDEARVEVDGPRFSRCLSYLLFANLMPGQEALFHVHRVHDSGAFTLSFDNLASQTDNAEPVLGIHNSTMHDGFMQLVAERELIRLGGSLEYRSLPSGTTQLTALLPLHSDNDQAGGEA